MRIVFLGRYNPTENISGPEYVARNVFYQIKKRNKDTSFVQYFFDGTEYSLFQKLFGNTTVRDGELIIYRKGLVPLFFYLIFTQPDIIHCITFERFQFIAVIYRLFSSVKLVYNVHGIIAYENQLHKLKRNAFYNWKDRIFEKFIYRKADILIFLSKLTIKKAKEYFMLDESKVVLFPNGVDERAIYQNKLDEKNDDNLKIVFVGETTRPEKGIEFLFDILEDVNCILKVFVIGNYDVKKEIKNKNVMVEYVLRMKNDDYLIFLHDKNIFISTSFYESFSIAALEAMAAGLVPILTAETGLTEYITHGGNGFVHNYGDTEQFVKTIEQLDNDRVLLTKISKAAQELAFQLNWEKIVERYYLPLYNNEMIKRTLFEKGR